MADLMSSALGYAWSKRSTITRIPGLYRSFAWATSRFGEGKVYRIRFGPLKDLRWKRFADLTYWYHMGLYEPDVSAVLSQHLRPGDVFWDIGANAGYHTLLAARLVGARGSVLAVEPAPRTAAIARVQIELNRLANAEVLERAIGNTEDLVEFRTMPNLLQSGLNGVVDGGEVSQVRSTTLDTLLDENGLPDLIKMDIEGAERIALTHGKRLFATEHAPRLLLATHGNDNHRFCRSFLYDHGYYFDDAPARDDMVLAIPRRGSGRSQRRLAGW